MGVGDGYVFGCIILFANFGTFFLYLIPPPSPPTWKEEKGVGDGHVFWMHFLFANFWKNFPLPHTPLPSPPPPTLPPTQEKEGRGLGVGVFLDAFFALFLNIFGPQPTPCPLPLTPWVLGQGTEVRGIFPPESRSGGGG